MPQTHRDVCVTCCHATTCINRGTPDSPVFECEEFFDQRPPPPPLLEGRFTPSREVLARNGEKSKGLCWDCQNRRHCGIRVLEGGVWHCEEYL